LQALLGRVQARYTLRRKIMDKTKKKKIMPPESPRYKAAANRAAAGGPYEIRSRNKLNRYGIVIVEVPPRKKKKV